VPQLRVLVVALAVTHSRKYKLDIYIIIKTGKDALSASVDIVTAADVVADLGGVEGKQITSPSPP
jgi:hypothetical protein